MELNTLISAMQAEIELSTGCTEVGCAALAAARAAEVLDQIPEQVSIRVSEYLYKNAANVCVPGTKMRGLEAALALGFIIRQSQLGLSILQQATAVSEDAARAYLKAHSIQVEIDHKAPPVFLRIQATTSSHQAIVEIAGEHSHFSEITLDDQRLVFDPPPVEGEENFAFRGTSPRELVEFITTQDGQVFSFLLNHAQTNLSAAHSGLNHPLTRFGPALNHQESPANQILRAACQTQTLTAAASEARMLGLLVPVAALTGSGNHGITALLGMHTAARELGADDSATATALAIAVMITIYVKHSTSRLTTFCGCAVAPAAGIAAGCVYLMGGRFEQMEQAMQSLIGTFAGMLCDGAKESCAWKVSTAASSAVQFAYLALNGAYVPANNGIVGKRIEDTFTNLGKLNNPGMVETNRVVMEIISQNLA